MFVMVSPYHSYDTETPWPFSGTFRLADASSAPREVRDPRIIAFINSHVDRPFFGEGDSTYFLSVTDVPDWFPPPATRFLARELYDAAVR